MSSERYEAEQQHNLGQSTMPATRYLKNAWAKKYANGDYWLFIQGGDLRAMFRLDAPRRRVAQVTFRAYLLILASAKGTLVSLRLVSS
jgi:hypothetical protein